MQIVLKYVLFFFCVMIFCIFNLKKTLYILFFGWQCNYLFPSKYGTLHIFCETKREKNANKNIHLINIKRTESMIKILLKKKNQSQNLQIFFSKKSKAKMSKSKTQKFNTLS